MPTVALKITTQVRGLAICRQRKFTTTITAAMVGIAAIGVAGCGGGSSTSALSKAQLIAKANAVCDSFGSAAKQIQVPADFTSNPVAAAAYLDRLLKLVEVEYGKLKALTPDSAVRSDYNTYLASAAIDIGSLKSGDAKAHAKDPAMLSVLRDEGIHSRDITAAAAANLGLTSCGGKKGG